MLPMTSVPRINTPAWCAHFDVRHYQDKAFVHYGIYFPPALRKAVTGRKAEYLAGRLASRQALGTAGFPAFTLRSGAGREPLWPRNIIGSISHCGSYALALASRQEVCHLRAIGLDIEMIFSEQRAARLWPKIISADEKALLAQTSLPFHYAITLAFSLKESLFKALYPTLKQHLSFHTAAITALDLPAAQINVCLEPALVAAGNFPANLTGHYYQHNHNVVTLLCF